ADVHDVGALGHDRVYALHRGRLVPGGALVVEGIGGPVDDGHDQPLPGPEGPLAEFHRLPPSPRARPPSWRASSPATATGVRSATGTGRSTGRTSPCSLTNCWSRGSPGEKRGERLRSA